MRLRKRPWFFAIIYLVLSLGIEASLIVFGGLRVPADNAKIAPIILTIPPVLAALFGGYIGLGEFLAVVFLTSLLTLILTLTFIRITGISTGFIEPIINRSIAGFLAAMITNRIGGTRRA
jgi:hypothetical protein